MFFFKKYLTIALLSFLCLPIGASTNKEAFQLYQTGNFELKIESLEKAEKLLIKSNNLESQLLLAKIMLAKGNYYFVMMQLSKGDKKAYSQFEKNYLDNMNHAIQFSNNLIKSNSKSALPHAILSLVYGNLTGYYQEKNDINKMLEYAGNVNKEADLALKLEPKSGIANFAKAMNYFFTPKEFGGDNDKAIEYFLKSIENEKTNPEYHVWLAKAYLNKKKKDLAIQSLNKSLQLYPDFSFAEEELRKLK